MERSYKNWEQILLDNGLTTKDIIHITMLILKPPEQVSVNIGKNKPYFTKCLPVEGEIIKGDKYFSNEGKVENAIVEGPYHQWLKRAKLFLCSRDIQVGDEYFIGDGVKYYCKTVKNGKVHAQAPMIADLKDCYKVIGEISPKATWVKEGMEFDEDEIERWIMCRSVGDCDHFKVELDDKRKIDIPDGRMYQYGTFELPYKIKGSCGYYH